MPITSLGVSNPGYVVYTIYGFSKSLHRQKREARMRAHYFSYEIVFNYVSLMMVSCAVDCSLWVTALRVVVVLGSWLLAVGLLHNR